MFNNLIESTGARSGARAGAFFLGTAAAWMAALCLLMAVGVFMYDARLDADFAEDSLRLSTPPPPAPVAPPPAGPAAPRPAASVVPRFVATREAPTQIARNPTPPIPPGSWRGIVSGHAPVGLPDSSDGVDGGFRESPGTDTSRVTPLPPPLPPAPEPVEPRRETRRVSEGVLVGQAIRKIQPAYPPMAKAANIQGQVTVEITISETGRVIAARALSGHPLLRAAAVSAAEQWAFSPTLLSRSAVKVVGTITFNFKRS